MRPSTRVLGALIFSTVAFAALAAPAQASQLIARDAHSVRLAVDVHGRALITYRSQGKAHHVLAWGAVNAIAPTRTRPQVEFHVDYSGGWGSSGKAVWKSFWNSCRAARVRLAWLVTACRARDGSYWALQSWQRTLPNYGLPATGTRGSWELRLSHWRGALPTLEVATGWAYGRFNSLFGRFTYRGRGVYGFEHTPRGVPLDSFGRNVYVDTLDSAYGRGWRRENGFLTHLGSGGFCYGFYPHQGRPSGMGTRYRVTVSGPGVTPDVMWAGRAPGAYDAQYDQASLLGSDPECRPR